MTSRRRTSPCTPLDLLGSQDPLSDRMPAPQELPVELMVEAHTIRGGRVQAMHEGKRRARARLRMDAPSHVGDGRGGVTHTPGPGALVTSRRPSPPVRDIRPPECDSGGLVAVQGDGRSP